ncbi:hypothetical protein BVC71_02055 [Marivivens niveibacter]|uniref:Multidrug resistance protein MdtA-like C-terminal permuted SH3 domain-containing protein n=1 Tax=Marivivens niveibacter TaxID=1930667 RepID=A0A251X1Q3_9RHOB|nr:efflux RND transporter periplasmic adaptor subunit [Marivivens niveibacter]OUD10318.1 hypothetical protein BVC71_02055 [Marivivens niveibacter]
MFRLIAATCALFTLPIAAFSDQPVLVEIVEVQKSAQTIERSLVGTVQAQDDYPVSFRTGGMIAEIAAEIGDHLEQGDLIARLENVTAMAQRDAATANLEAALAQRTQAETTRDRTQGSLDRGTATQSDLDRAQQAFIAAQSAYRQAETELSKAQQAVDDTEIRADEAVIVIDRFANAGEIVGAGTTVAELASDSRLEVQIDVPDTAGLDQLSQLPVTIIPIDGGSEITARISEISPVVSSAGTVSVTALLPDNTDIAIGTLVRIQVTFPSTGDFIVPAEALALSAGNPAVWVVDPNTNAVSARQVSISRYDETSIYISDGLVAGDLIVGRGAHTLFDGRIITTGADK